MKRVNRLVVVLIKGLVMCKLVVFMIIPRKGKKKMGKRIWVVTIVSILFLFSCASLPQKIQKNILNQNFDQALLELEEKGVGAQIEGTPKEEELEARKIYSEGVYEFYKHKVSNLENSGLPRQAYDKALEAQRYCVWSPEIKLLVKQSKALVDKINESQKKWRYLSAEKSLSINDARELLIDTKSIENYFNDTPLLMELQNKATSTIILYWATLIEKEGINFNEYEAFTSEIEALPQNIDGNESVFESLKNLLILTNYSPPSEDKHNTLKQEEIEAFKSLIDHFLLNKKYRYLYPCNNSIRLAFDDWSNKQFILYLNDDQVNIETILSAEYYLENYNQIRSTFNSHLANGHLNFAKRKSKQGKAALLTLISLKRIEELDKTFNKKDIQGLYSRSLTSLNSTKHLYSSINVGVNPEIDPFLFNLFSTFLYSEIESRTNDGFSWHWSVNSLKNSSDLNIHIQNLKFYSPSLEDLNTIESRYLSHYEDVPNPMKAFYESQVDSAEWNMNTAESTYNSAVNSHNWNPTQWSLSNANNAYTNYKYAVDRYNSAVRTYNSTPSTISREVYLPYSFQQGNVSSGWFVEVLVTINGKSYTYKKRDVDTDFVRIGAKYNDKNVSYRTNDTVDIDTSTENLIQKLNSIIIEGGEKLGLLLFDLKYQFPFSSGLEEAILSKIYHPYGFKFSSKNGEFNPWLERTLSELTIPKTEIHAEKILLKSSGFKAPDNIEKFINESEKFICMIKTDFGHGSGTLISNNGLILTCAHVLMGSEIQVVFKEGLSNKSYKAEIVFIDDKNDVALIKAKNYKSSTWANIRLSKPAIKGEKIVAIGNPTIGNIGATNISGASSGIISNPKITLFGTERVVADITIASGSSGGPIFSLKTGEVIGVVTAVYSPGHNIDTDTSSSGFSCLAAPSDNLRKWLNLFSKR